MRSALNAICFMLIILFFVTFSLSNTQSVQLSYLGFIFDPVPVSLLILIPFLVGIILGSLMDLLERFSLKKEVKQLKKQVEELKEQPKPHDRII